ncbi:MAG: plastocyanin/azurin family copper-binding protein [Gemmatimonadales bacterium]
MPARSFLVALVAIGVIGAGSAAAAGRSGPRPPRTHTVEMSGMEFHPATLEVQPGDTVVWINRDIVPHTATATGKPAWDTGPILQGKSGRYVPKHRGAFPYACTFHPVMLGKLMVK